jgi:SET domain
MDRSKEAMAFYSFLESNGAGENLKRCAMGYFPLPGGGSLRGVVALKDMKKGDVIIRIPYEIAVNLGVEGEDPTIPGLALLKLYCETLASSNSNDSRSTYFRMLPPFGGEDCMGSTDFFPDNALEALQAPLVLEETTKRRERAQRRFEQNVATNHEFPPWIDDSPITEEHLRWASWLITSRVLTVQGNAEENKSYRLLIPFLDMCNHDRTSPHVLTGRAIPGGELKVVAGVAVSAGDQINICYGGGVAGNDRFLQDYGFLDDESAFNIVVQQLLGKRRVGEGATAGRSIAMVDRDATLEKLRSTTTEHDESLLDSTTSALRSAIQYRIGVKKALAKYQ